MAALGAIHHTRDAPKEEKGELEEAGAQSHADTATEAMGIAVQEMGRVQTRGFKRTRRWCTHDVLEASPGRERGLWRWRCPEGRARLVALDGSPREPSESGLVRPVLTASGSPVHALHERCRGCSAYDWLVSEKLIASCRGRRPALADRW